MKPVNDTELTTFIRKRGTELNISAPKVELRNLTHVEAAKKLRETMRSHWNGAEHMGWLKKRYPDGVPESELNEIVATLSRPQSTAAPLRVIN